MTYKSKVWFDSKDLKALGDPFHEVGAEFAGEIEWDYSEYEDGSFEINWYAYRLKYSVGINKWISIDPAKRCINILRKKFNSSRGPTSLSYLN